MSTKRKRNQADAAEVNGIGSGIGAGGVPAKKRKGRQTNEEKHIKKEAAATGRAIIDILRQHKNSEGKLTADHLMRTPSRRVDPEYYKQISVPMDFAKISAKLNSLDYVTFTDFVQDIELLFSNALSYYKEDTDENKSAKELQVVFEDLKKRVESGEKIRADGGESDEDDKSSIASGIVENKDRSISPMRADDDERASTASPVDIDGNMCEDIVVGILELADKTGRLICPPFRVLQSKEEFPLYYEKISSPIDLKKIAEKSRAGEYKTFNDLEADIRLLCRNAQQFSGKGTEIYRDAITIMDFYRTKSEQVMEKGVHPKRREKIHRIIDGLLQQTASAWGTDMYSEDSEEDEDTETDQDPKWRLYWTIRNKRSERDKNVNLVESFLELPSRTYYPDYYDEISNPMSLFMINKKLKAGKYIGLEHVLKDFLQICYNACEYNIEGSEIYEDAKKLEELALKTVKLLQPELDLSEYEQKPQLVMGSPGTSAKLPPIVKQQKTPKTPAAKPQMLKRETMDEPISTDSDSRTPPPVAVPSTQKKKYYKKPRYQLSTGLSADNIVQNNKPGRKTMDELMLRFRVKLMTYWQYLHDYKEPGEYWPVGAFMELPDRVHYPDYYDYIQNPIDMHIIRERIENNKYDRSDQLMDDFSLMFDNACAYNEPNSQIAHDAIRLKEMVFAKHANDAEAPVESPLAQKERLGWVKLRLITEEEKKKKGLNGASRTPRTSGTGVKKRPSDAAIGRNSESRNSISGNSQSQPFFSDDESSNSSIRSPHPAQMQSGGMPTPSSIPTFGKKRNTNNFHKGKKGDRNSATPTPQPTGPPPPATHAHGIVPPPQPYGMPPVYDPYAAQYPMGYPVPPQQHYPAHPHSHLPPPPPHPYYHSPFPHNYVHNPYQQPPPPSHGYPPYVHPAGPPPTAAPTASAPPPLPVQHQPPPTHSTVQQDKLDKVEEMLLKLPEDQQRMWRLLNAIKDHRDKDGRRLSTAFHKLPTKEELPHYYEVIKRPMDLHRIQQRLQNQGYPSWAELVVDMTLMLDNACKYNETDSSIYKDAVALQCVLQEKKRELGAMEDSTPKVQVEVKTIFTNIFAKIFGMKDLSGHCHSDSFSSFTDQLKARHVPVSEWPFTFDQIKRNIDKCRYRRLDRFQKDFFDLFDKAREISKPGQQLYEDAVTLQLKFVEQRDSLCKDYLSSSAFVQMSYKDLEEKIEYERSSKKGDKAEPESLGHAENEHEIGKKDGEEDIDMVTVKDVNYSIPCYAYVARIDEAPKGPPHIMRIERIFKNENGDTVIRGKWVYRPQETIHLASRKFIKNEVFITPFIDTVLPERLLGRCHVLSYKTYQSSTVKGIEEADLYVCESRYLGKPKYFAKLKGWPYAEEEKLLSLEPRSRPLSPIRVTSDAMKKEGRKEDSKERDETDEEEAGTPCSTVSDEDERVRNNIVLDIDRPEVIKKDKSDQQQDADGRTYFWQMRTKGGRAYCLGQFVLVFNPQKPLCDIMRIDKLWREQDGSEWFSGGWFARPIDIEHDEGRMFYPREVFAVDQPDQTRKVDDIQSRCYVLQIKDYQRIRPTEIPECDVFVCEKKVKGHLALPPGEFSSLFIKPFAAGQAHTNGTSSTQSATAAEDEAELPPAESSATTAQPMHFDHASIVRKFKKYELPATVADDEKFSFKQPIAMEKEMSPLIKNEIDVPLDPLDMEFMEEQQQKMAAQKLQDGQTMQVAVEKDKAEGEPPEKKYAAEKENGTGIEQSAEGDKGGIEPVQANGVVTADQPSSSNAQQPIGTQTWLAAQPKLNAKSKSGYILFSAEIRKRIMHENPEAGFGEISKIVGIEWKKLSDSQKKQYEVRAEYIANERTKEAAIRAAQERTLQPGQLTIYQCKWVNCDSQFDAESGLYEHIIQHHTSQIIIDSDQQYVCMWVTCMRNKKEGKAFPSLPRLHRHMKERHLTTSNRNVYQNQLGRNYFKLQQVQNANGEIVSQLVHTPYGKTGTGSTAINCITHSAQSAASGPQHQQSQVVRIETHPLRVSAQGPPQINGHHLPTVSSAHSHSMPPPHHSQQPSGHIPHHQSNIPSSPMHHHQAPPPSVHHNQQPIHHYASAPSSSHYQQPVHSGAQQHVSQASSVPQPGPPPITDPGRTIVRIAPTEPVFVPAPNSIQAKRALHSETYLRYIESLGTNRQRSVSKWDKSLGATHKNTQPQPNGSHSRAPPTHWIRDSCPSGSSSVKDDEVVKALWRLRDEMLETTCNLAVEREGSSRTQHS